MYRKTNVRKITKFKRSVKAISPVIATLLMIAIAVVASLVAYASLWATWEAPQPQAGKAIKYQAPAVDKTAICWCMFKTWDKDQWKYAKYT